MWSDGMCDGRDPRFPDYNAYTVPDIFAWL